MTKTIRLPIEFRGTEAHSGSALHCNWLRQIFWTYFRR